MNLNGLSKRTERLEALAPAATRRTFAYVSEQDLVKVAAIAASVGCGISQLCTRENLHKVTDEQLDELERICLRAERETGIIPA